MNSGSKQIDLNTKISALIKTEPLVIEALISINSHFSKLRNPFLRKMLAGRVTIADACRIAGCKPGLFLAKMEELGFEMNYSDKASAKPQEADLPEDGRATIIKAAERLIFDVRPILAESKDPLKLILEKTATLKKGESIKLVNTFEPIPLISILRKKGFIHFTEIQSKMLCNTWIMKTSEDDHSLATETGGELPTFDELLSHYSPDLLVSVDVRQLPMPEPMLLILSQLERLPSEKALFVYHKKIPVYLLQELKSLGYKYSMQEISNDLVNLLIYKNEQR